MQLESWIAHDRDNCIDQHSHAAVAVSAEELAGDRRLLARSGIVVDRLRDLIVTDAVDGLLGNSPVRVERRPNSSYIAVRAAPALRDF